VGSATAATAVVADAVQRSSAKATPKQVTRFSPKINSLKLVDRRTGRAETKLPHPHPHRR
jgi:hypothetical protein